MTGFISTSFTISRNHTYYSVIADLQNLQFTIAHALGFSVSSSRPLAADLNTETSTSNRHEVFLPFLVRSPWYLGTQLKTFLDCKQTHVVLPLQGQHSKHSSTVA
jgi:hypothetical protein